MLNFYQYYNNTGLDHDEYRDPIEQWKKKSYTDDVGKIKHILKKNPYHAVWYARLVIKGRWYEAEPIIMKDPRRATQYVRYVLKLTRWLDAEPYIMKDPYYAYRYAYDVIQGRWHEAEQYMKQDPDWWDAYTWQFKISEPGCISLYR